MENREQKSYNFNSVDLLIYIWNKRITLMIVGFVAALTSMVIALLITPMFSSSVIMFPASNASVARGLLAQNYSGNQSVYGFGEEEQAEQLLQVLHSEPIRTRIIEKYELMEHYEIDPEGKYPLTELYEQFSSNINFRLTEFMSVEISVMDSDPEISASIANDISDLVDTVFNSMKKERAINALELVEHEYLKSETDLVTMQDSLNMISNHISQRIKNTGDPADNLVLAFAEHGVTYMSMMHQMRNEVGMMINMRYRLNEARMEEQQNLPYKFVVERAIPPEKKAYPNKSLIVIVSTFASLLFALIVLIVIDNVKSRLAVIKEK
ncbi:MAG: hypothetical protein GY790_07010 [Bacteroidetes bacterium]|nr:hypothetical protein [Bacteroidota bacterium]